MSRKHSRKLLRRGPHVLGLFTYIIIIIICVCDERAYYCMHVVFREQVCGVWFDLPTFLWVLGLNLACQTCVESTFTLAAVFVCI